MTVSFANNGWLITKSDGTQVKSYANQYPSVTVTSPASFTFDGVRGLTSADTVIVTSGALSINLIVVPLGYADLCSNTVGGYKTC